MRPGIRPPTPPSHQGPLGCGVGSRCRYDQLDLGRADGIDELLGAAKLCHDSRTTDHTVGMGATGKVNQSGKGLSD